MRERAGDVGGVDVRAARGRVAPPCAPCTLGRGFGQRARTFRPALLAEKGLSGRGAGGGRKGAEGVETEVVGVDAEQARRPHDAVLRVLLYCVKVRLRGSSAPI